MGNHKSTVPSVAVKPTDSHESWVIKNCNLPRDLYYDVEHDMWARKESNGDVSLGLTDVGQTAVGKLQIISFTRRAQMIGQRLEAGHTIALLESAKWVGPVRLPVPGILIRVNTDLLTHPLWVNLEPYGNGWVVVFRPDEEIPWMHGEKARDAYAQRLTQTFRSVAGVNDDFWCVHCNDWDEL